MINASDRDLIEKAVGCINRLLESGFYGRGEAWIRAWYRHDLKWSDTTPKYVTIPENKVSEFVALGRTEPQTYDLVCFVAGTRLVADAQLPQEMLNFAGKVLSDELSRPKGKPGRSSQWARNFIIIRTMKEINPGTFFDGEDARFPTANLDQRGVRARDLSASEIVFEALQQTEIGRVDKKTINDVWSSKKWQAAHNDAYSLYLGGMLDDLDEASRI
jgi:hypothetical protein